MLKDITLGQYFPGDSYVHKLDPRTKLIMVVLYIVALFCAVRWVSYLTVFLFLAACIYLFLTFILTKIVTRLENHFSRHEAKGV